MLGGQEEKASLSKAKRWAKTFFLIAWHFDINPANPEMGSAELPVERMLHYNTRCLPGECYQVSAYTYPSGFSKILHRIKASTTKIFTHISSSSKGVGI